MQTFNQLQLLRKPLPLAPEPQASDTDKRTGQEGLFLSLSCTHPTLTQDSSEPPSQSTSSALMLHGWRGGGGGDVPHTQTHSLLCPAPAHAHAHATAARVSHTPQHLSPSAPRTGEDQLALCRSAAPPLAAPHGRLLCFMLTCAACSSALIL